MKLLVVLIGLACIVPGLQQKQKNTNTQRFKNAASPANAEFNFQAILGNTNKTPSVTRSSAPKSCKSPDKKNGVCLRLEKCEPFRTRLLKNPSDASFIKELKKSNEICAKEYAVVCCPSATNAKLTQNPLFPANKKEVPKKLPSMQDGCGYRKPSEILRSQVVGGVTSEIGAWPWIALIGYNDSRSASPFKCGGALITSRHVVTAAHCIKSSLSFVRLGEHDLGSSTETKHIDVPVSKILRHPKYNPKDGHSDIAVLFLSRNVPFSAEITPICLPFTKQLLTKSFVDNYPFVAGWGRTREGGKSSERLQELRIPVYNNSICKDLYKKQNKLISEQQFNNAVLCAGDLRGGKDTCQGDSGGPLMIAERFKNTDRFHLIGVVSYGIGCARPDSPGVYTKVTHFMDWIKNAVKNQNLFKST